MLIEKGADVNVKINVNGNQLSALQIATRDGKEDLVDLLRKAGAKE
jgi:ankyrin repeat protein